MDKLQKILREYLNKGSERIDVTMVLALIDQFEKDTKEQLLLHNVSISLVRAKKYARHQHFLGTQGKDLVEFEDWKQD
tara:strand:+ start:386 stop:619 length:234 start_codon:yes stop_codon:yes gene_type:complete